MRLSCGVPRSFFLPVVGLVLATCRLRDVFSARTAEGAVRPPESEGLAVIDGILPCGRLERCLLEADSE